MLTQFTDIYAALGGNESTNTDIVDHRPVTVYHVDPKMAVAQISSLFDITWPGSRNASQDLRNTTITEIPKTPELPS